MKNFLLSLLTVALVALALYSGSKLIELFKYLGANLVTMKEVIGCYVFSFLACLVIWIFAAIYIDNKVK